MASETDTPSRDGEPPQAERGLLWEGDDATVLAALIESAFDYRGDVTLLLATGDELEGYVSNRDAEADEPWLDVLPKAGSASQRVPYSALRGVHFSGKDTASGKSWETWVKKFEAKKAARDRGENVGTIGLFPEEDD